MYNISSRQPELGCSPNTKILTWTVQAGSTKRWVKMALLGRNCLSQNGPHSRLRSNNCCLKSSIQVPGQNMRFDQENLDVTSNKDWFFTNNRGGLVMYCKIIKDKIKSLGNVSMKKGNQYQHGDKWQVSSGWKRTHGLNADPQASDTFVPSKN